MLHYLYPLLIGGTNARPRLIEALLFLISEGYGLLLFHKLSFGLLIVLDDLVELGQLLLLDAVELLAYQQLRVYAVGHLLLELLYAGVHPVLVLAGRLEALSQ